MADFGFGSIAEGISQAEADVNGLFGQFGVSLGTPEGKIYGLAKDILSDLSNIQPGGTPWDIDGEDWYKVYSYQFVITDSKAFGSFGNKDEIIYTLPIPPQSMSVRMIPASQATATIGGVVEETNANVFWSLNMSGTTGIAVSRIGTGANRHEEMAKVFRDNVPKQINR